MRLELRRSAIHASLRLVIAAAFIMAPLPVLAFAAAGDELPRYKFKAGQEISYRSDHESQDEPDNADAKAKKGSTRSVREWTVWVVRQNTDSTWRLIFKMRMLTIHKDGKGDEERRTDHRFFAYCDMASDGQFMENPSLTSFVDVRNLFPRLPADEKILREGWTANSKYIGDESRSNFRLVDAGVGSSNQLVFNEVRTTDLDPIYLTKRKNTYRFNLKRGLVDVVSTRSSYGWSGLGGLDLERACKLVGVEQADRDWLNRFDMDMQNFFAPIKMCEDAVAAMQRDVRVTETQLAKIESALTKARAAAKLPITQELLDEQLEGLESTAKYFREEAAKYQPMFGKPAPEWELEDLNGKKHKLSDYRGKVVVLDFWNRGCGYCVRAIPALAQLANDFKDKPVAILGMNDDENIDDARFVDDYFKIAYPTLRASDVLEDYGISSWPAVFVLDTKGNIRQIRFGQTATLREDLAAQINGLLNETQPR